MYDDLAAAAAAILSIGANLNDFIIVQAERESIRFPEIFRNRHFDFFFWLFSTQGGGGVRMES
jgi:hypothetical protein